MTDFRHLKIQVQRRLTHHLMLANTFFERAFIAPTVYYNVRGGKAGVAYLLKNEIRFNPILLQENAPSFIEQVVPHELAHIIVFQQFGRVQPHGKEWKMVMESVFHLPAEIYHNFDLTNVQKQVLYQCACQTHALSIQRHRAIQQSHRIYLCKHCKAPLVLKSE